MESNLQHEDLLIKLRAKLNEDKVQLWEAPYYDQNNENTERLHLLARTYAEALTVDYNILLLALKELQAHSIERSKANTDFKDHGLATVRVRASIPKEKMKQFNVQRKLTVAGSELIAIVSKELSISESQVKLIFNGKVIKPTATLEEQGLKNGTQVLALIMSERPEEVKREDNMYLEMKATRDDATLLSEYVDELGDDDEYMKLEDQSGKVVELPPHERRALLVGLALHERGRTAVRQENYSLALVLLLEADRHFSECDSSVLTCVDNWAVLQLDIAWCYLCLQSLASAGDAALRLKRAEDSLHKTYGANLERLVALKGSAANERVLLMRLYLLQAIVSYHQNNRTQAAALLDKAESEMRFLRVDESGVLMLMELGWSSGQARTGLRVSAGDVTRAHDYLTMLAEQRQTSRDKARDERKKKVLGVCLDGSAVMEQFVDMLVGMGFPRRQAVCALRHSNNHVSDAVRIIQEHPELLSDDSSSEGSESADIEKHISQMISELVAMGYPKEMASAALELTGNNLETAIDMLVAGNEALESVIAMQATGAPSTSEAGGSSNITKSEKREKKDKKEKRRIEREEAFQRLSSGIQVEDDDHLTTSLEQEEQFLAQYKSLL